MFGPFPSQDIEALGWNPLETHSSSLCLLAPSMATSITAACQSLRFFFNFFFHVDVNIRSCHTAVTNLMAALQEGEPMLLTFGAAAAWSSWSTPVPSCLQGTRTAGGEIHQLGPTQSNQSAQCYQQDPACCPQLQQEKKS